MEEEEGREERREDGRRRRIQSQARMPLITRSSATAGRSAFLSWREVEEERWECLWRCGGDRGGARKQKEEEEEEEEEGSAIFSLPLSLFPPLLPLTDEDRSGEGGSTATASLV